MTHLLIIFSLFALASFAVILLYHLNRKQDDKDKEFIKGFFKRQGLTLLVLVAGVGMLLYWAWYG
jgi:cell division protein FtsW (lipid II flippase)